MTRQRLATRTKLGFGAILLGIVLVVTITLGEILMRVISPVGLMYPRWQFSAEYGLLPFANVQMVHTVPGKWRFTYTTNEYHHRGPAVPVSNSYPRTNVVVLGDSYTFGEGVDDGEEYAAIMRETLSDQFDVINLGVVAWGLTQQIRRFYEFGQLYRPKIVIVQFTSNDPDDNFNNPVTTIVDGRFVFRDSINSINWVKKYLSNSIIQKSQIYNLFRDSAYRFFERRNVKRNTEAFRQSASDSISPAEQYYAQLLELFAADLERREIKLLMIAVNGHLDEFPHIKGTVSRLHAVGSVQYIEVSDWFGSLSSFESPEGHYWGAKAHQVIGARLSKVIQQLDDQAP